MPTPTTPVILPPVRNEIRRGLRFEKSFDGDTTFAATFVVSVATNSAIREMNAATGWLKRPIRSTGSHTGSLKIGRASCRERGKIWVLDVAVYRRYRDIERVSSSERT